MQRGDTFSHLPRAVAGALMLINSTMFTPEWRPRMTPSSTTTVVALYQVRPGQRDQWLQTWRQLVYIARSYPECRSFTLDVDSARQNRCRVVSTWTSSSAFDRFVRAVGLPWIERCLDYSTVPPRYHRFTLPQSEPTTCGKTPPIKVPA
jgi:quinol monooxygenase YgiN